MLRRGGRTSRIRLEIGLSLEVLDCVPAHFVAVTAHQDRMNKTDARRGNVECRAKYCSGFRSLASLAVVHRLSCVTSDAAYYYYY